jgi:hypothetical protein
VDRIATSVQESGQEAKSLAFAIIVEAAKQISQVVIGKFIAEKQQS